MQVLLVGDVHGHIQALADLVSGSTQRVVQLGDLGLGFSRVVLPDLGPRFGFIRGNHDSPVVARQSPHFLGDFGFDALSGAFWMGGAWSIDAAWRTPGINWWSDEELSLSQLEAAFALFCDTSPRVVWTHDCPSVAFDALPSEGKLLGGAAIPTRTTDALITMFEQHQPDVWVFGHHHVSWQGTIGKTRFRCLDELESAVLDTETLQWL